MSAGVRVHCVNKSVCVWEIKCLEEVEREATGSSASFTQHTSASSVWVLKRKKKKRR